MAEQKDIAQEFKDLPDETRQLVINIITKTIVKYALEHPERNLSFDLKVRDGKIISFRSGEK